MEYLATESIVQPKNFSFLLRHDMSEFISLGVGGKEHSRSVLQSPQVDFSLMGITRDAVRMHATTHPACPALFTAPQQKMSTTQHHKQQWQLLEEPGSSKDSFGQTCLCLSNHTRSLQTQIINFAPLLSLQTCSHLERKTSSQGQVGTFTEWALTLCVLVA